MPLLFVSAVGLWLTFLALSALAALEGACAAWCSRSRHGGRRRHEPDPGAGDPHARASWTSGCPGAASSTGPPSSAARWPSAPASTWRCGRARPTAPSASAATPGAAAAAPAARASPSSAARSTAATTTAPTNTVMGGWWKADNSSYCGGPRYYMDCNATCTCDTGCGDGLAFCETGLRRHRLRLRPAGLRLLHHRVPPVPLRPVQPGRGLHGPDRLPGGGLRAPVAGRPLVHDGGGRRQRDRRAERAVLDAGAARAAPCESPATNCQVVGIAASPSGGGYGVLTSFGRLFPYGDFADRGRRVRAAARRPRSWPSPPARAAGTSSWPPTAASSPTAARPSTAPWAGSRSTPRSWAWRPRPAGAATGSWRPTAASSPSATPRSTAPWAGSTSTADRRHGGHPDGQGLLAGGGRRRHLRLRRRPVLRLHGRAAPQPADRRHGGHPHGQRLLARGGRRRHLRLRRRRLRRVDRRHAPQQAGGGMAASGSDAGYWLVAQRRGIFAFGGAPFLGSAA